MRAIILGASPACPNPGGACSGYLVEQDGVRLLVDCGTGVLGALRQHVDYDGIFAILISHMHADHFFDLVPYRYGLKYGLRQPKQRPLLYLPPDGKEILDATASLFGDANSFFSEVFDVRDYDPQTELEVGKLRVRFARTRHYVPTYAMLIVGRKVLAYSADTGPCEEVASLAAGADLFICEAGQHSLMEVRQERGHLTASEAGMLARQAKVRKLLVTHFWKNGDEGHLLADAQKSFGGDTELAVEGRTHIL